LQQKSIIRNRFFSLLGESLRLLNEAEKCDDEILKNCLITSSILTCAYSLEAAANSVLETVEPKVNERDFSTLGKFSLVLEHHLDKKIDSPQVVKVKPLANFPGQTLVVFSLKIFFKPLFVQVLLFLRYYVRVAVSRNL